MEFSTWCRKNRRGTKRYGRFRIDNLAHALRALIQGMGFQSELYLSKMKVDGKRVVVPGLQNLDGRAQHISLFTLSAFDNLLSGSTTFASHGKVLAGANRQPTMVMKDMPRVLINNEKVVDSMIELYRMIESESLRIKFSNNDSILMYHFRFDEDYTPIRYFGNVLSSGPDFLMSPFFRPGTTLKSEMKKLKVDSPIGPYTIRVMEALGYATKANPQILELELVI